jgi:hypothetical protein
MTWPLACKQFTLIALQREKMSMSLKPKSVLILLVWSLFMGVTAISIGVGAVFPPLNQIAQPFICSNGQMRVDSQTYRPQPGTTVTTLDWQCVDKQTGKAQRINEMSMFLINGLIYGSILFAIIIIWRWAAAKRQSTFGREPAADSIVAGLEHHRTAHVATSFDIPESEELRKLMSLRDSGLITEQDYEQKKAEILSRL